MTGAIGGITFMLKVRVRTGQVGGHGDVAVA
jgi:hypothetical protein